jgi:hypothetical protein
MAGVFDAGTQSIYFFGGDAGAAGPACGAAPAILGDTWRYDIRCKRWVELHPAQSPPARSDAAAVLETVSGAGTRMVVAFGRAADAARSLLADVWAFDLTALQWNPLSPTGTAPTARAGVAAGFYPATDVALFFGGDGSADASAPVPTADLWQLDLHKNEWKPLAPTSAGPAARHQAGGVVDYIAAAFDVGFGLDARGAPLGDLYAYDIMGNKWSGGAVPAGGPAPRSRAGLSFDESGQLLLFGGLDAGPLGPRNDLWSYQLASKHWAQLFGADAPVGPRVGCPPPPAVVQIATGTPERRAGMLFAVGYPGPGYVLGGLGDCGALDDLWAVLVPTGWVNLEPAHTGLDCVRAGRTGCTNFCQ